ncbi:MAG TPA: ABC transporter substrate-binding protein, partial [Rhodopila sp.]
MTTQARRVSRRRAMKLAAAVTALPLVHIRTGRAAGKLTVGFWDHWVPEGNDIMKKQCAAFGAAHQVEVAPDFITSNGAKNILTIAAEAQAKTGHDIQQFPEWEVQNHADQLEPVDDVMQRLTSKYGGVAAASQYLFNIKGHWLAVPCSSGNQNKGPCGRISVLKQAGLDVVKMYPPSADATPDA